MLLFPARMWLSWRGARPRWVQGQCRKRARARQTIFPGRLMTKNHSCERAKTRHQGGVSGAHRAPGVAHQPSACNAHNASMPAAMPSTVLRLLQATPRHQRGKPRKPPSRSGIARLGRINGPDARHGRARRDCWERQKQAKRAGAPARWLFHPAVSGTIRTSLPTNPLFRNSSCACRMSFRAKVLATTGRISPASM